MVSVRRNSLTEHLTELYGYPNLEFYKQDISNYIDNVVKKIEEAFEKIKNSKKCTITYISEYPFKDSITIKYDNNVLPFDIPYIEEFKKYFEEEVLEGVFEQLKEIGVDVKDDIFRKWFYYDLSLAYPQSFAFSEGILHPEYGIIYDTAIEYIKTVGIYGLPRPFEIYVAKTIREECGLDFVQYFDIKFKPSEEGIILYFHGDVPAKEQKFPGVITYIPKRVEGLITSCKVLRYSENSYKISYEISCDIEKFKEEIKSFCKKIME